MNDLETRQKLASRRVLFLFGPITKEKVDELREHMILLSEEPNEKEIRLLIDTMGGHVEPSLYLTDFMRSLDVPIWGIVNGQCHSAGIVILQGCHKRYATANSWLHVHSVRATFEFNSSETEERELRWQMEKKETEEVFSHMVSLISSRTGMSEEGVRAMCAEGDKARGYHSASKAKELGLIDDCWPHDSPLLVSS